MRCLTAAVLAAVLTIAAHGAATSPLEKVTTLLTELRAKVSSEGGQEAATYERFACFCRDASAAKTSAIARGETSKNDLQARLNDAGTRRDQEDASIKQKEQAVLTLEGEISELRGERRADALKYAKSEVDLTRASQGLEAAIQMLKSAKTATGLLEVGKAGDSLRQAISMAEALAPTDAGRRLSAALLQSDEVPGSVYAFHADDVISTLEALKAEFFKKKVDLDNQEDSARRTFEALLQDKESAIAGHEAALESHRQNKAAETRAIALASQDLTVTSAQLLDDQRYLTELSTECNEKALAWDRRTQTRENELVALTRAIEIMQSAAVASESAAASFIQLREEEDTVDRATGEGTSWRAPRMTTAFVSAHSPASVRPGSDRGEPHQLQSRLRGGRAIAPAQDWRGQAATLLRTKAGDLHSALLLRLAGTVAEGPFGKVKQLIQELIEKLLRDAQAEADHKGWCDEQAALAEEARDRSADSIHEVNARLEAGEARRAKLASQIQDLDEELQSLNATLSSSNETRQQERVENLAAIQDAERGRDAVAQAIGILERFYREAAANATSLALLEAKGGKASGQLSTAASASNGTDATLGGSPEDAPDAGFSGAYSGAVGAEAGILGLLDVIRSDFERTVSDTLRAEANAERVYNELQTTAGASQAAKGEARASRERSLREADAEDRDDRGSLARLQATLDQALNELEALRSSCVGGGTSAEERRAQREQEMEALKKVLCILEQHGVGGIESC